MFFDCSFFVSLCSVFMSIRYELLTLSEAPLHADGVSNKAPNIEYPRCHSCAIKLVLRKQSLTGIM